MQFFRGLERHNNRDWFLPRKPLFEEHVKLPMRRLIEAVNGALAKFAPHYVTEPDKAVFRFYRDTRFSKDKKPYKDHIAANFVRRGLVRHEGAGYYFAVSHKSVAVGGGVYMPMPETLAAMRQHFAAHPDEFRRLIGGSAVRRLYGAVQGEQLTRVPKGFPSDHPAADLVRYKQVYYYKELDPSLATTPAVCTEIVKHFRAIAPFVEFLNAPLANARRKPDLSLPSSRFY
jgi:uncharacterized protein (TIGR02453 family)